MKPLNQDRLTHLRVNCVIMFHLILDLLTEYETLIDNMPPQDVDILAVLVLGRPGNFRKLTSSYVLVQTVRPRPDRPRPKILVLVLWRPKQILKIVVLGRPCPRPGRPGTSRPAHPWSITYRRLFLLTKRSFYKRLSLSVD